jgi:hypothetical protein
MGSEQNFGWILMRFGEIIVLNFDPSPFFSDYVGMPIFVSQSSIRVRGG